MYVRQSKLGNLNRVKEALEIAVCFAGCSIKHGKYKCVVIVLSKTLWLYKVQGFVVGRPQFACTCSYLRIFSVFLSYANAENCVILLL